MSYRALVMAVVAVLGMITPAVAADPVWTLSTSFNYSRGDYGTNEDTTLVYVPFTLGVRPIERLTVTVTIPYVYQSSRAVSLTGGGVAVRKDKLRSGRSVDESEQGLGDILLKVSYVVLEERDVLPEIAAFGKIKFPTADESKALGTGEFDETFGVDVAKTFAERWIAFASLAYTFVGSPSGADLDNTFAWSLGAAYRVSTPLSVFAFLDGATAITPGQSDPLELRVGAEYRLSTAWRFTGTVGKGLTNGAPDWSLSAGLGYRF